MQHVDQSLTVRSSRWGYLVLLIVSLACCGLVLHLAHVHQGSRPVLFTLAALAAAAACGMGWFLVHPSILLQLSPAGLSLGRGPVLKISDIKYFFLMDRIVRSPQGRPHRVQTLNLVVWYHAHLRVTGLWMKDAIAGELCVYIDRQLLCKDSHVICMALKQAGIQEHQPPIGEVKHAYQRLAP